MRAFPGSVSIAAWIGPVGRVGVGIAAGEHFMATAASPAGRGDLPLDTSVRLVTPERIGFEYPLAGPFRRVYAYAIDAVVVTALALTAMIVAIALSVSVSPSWIGAGLAAYFAIVWGYGATCEVVFRGRTPGKFAAGIRVVSDAGVPIAPAQALIRNLIGAAEGLLPFCYLPALASMVLSPKFQRLGDLAAGTMVVVEEPRWRIKVEQVDSPEIRRVLALLPLQVAAGPELSRALADYVRARPRFGDARREEMAEHLAGPLRRRQGLPADLPADAVLGAVYHRIFHGE